MLASWIAKLQEYPLEVEYIRGSENTIADLLSRMVFHAVDQPIERKKPVNKKSDLQKICPVETSPDPPSPNNEDTRYATEQD